MIKMYIHVRWKYIPYVPQRRIYVIEINNFMIVIVHGKYAYYILILIFIYYGLIILLMSCNVIVFHVFNIFNYYITIGKPNLIALINYQWMKNILLDK